MPCAVTLPLIPPAQLTQAQRSMAEAMLGATVNLKVVLITLDLEFFENVPARAGRLLQNRPAAVNSE